MKYTFKSVQILFFTLIISGILLLIKSKFANNKSNNVQVQSEENEKIDQEPLQIFIDKKKRGGDYLSNITNIGMVKECGAINTLCVDLTDSNHIIACSRAGGLWKSFNRGKTWAPINDFAPTLNGAWITQDPFRKNEFYYCTGADVFINGVLQNDIYKSTDYGNTFTPVIFNSSSKFGNIQKIVCSTTDSNVAYFFNSYVPTNVAGMVTKGGLYKTTDHFKTFTKVFESSLTNDFALLSDGRVWVANNKKVFISNTGNVNTFTIANGIDSNVSVSLRVDACRDFPNIGFASSLANNGGVKLIYKTINGGANWTIVDTSNLSGSPPDQVIKVHPSNPNIVIFGYVGFQYSVNGGTTWTQAYGITDPRDFTFDPYNTGLLYMCHDWGITSTQAIPFTNASFNLNTYKQYDSTLFVQDIYTGDYSNSEYKGIISLQDLGTQLSFNNTTTKKFMGGDGVSSFLNKQDTNTAYFCAQGGKVFKGININSQTFSYSLSLNQLDANNNGTIDDGSCFFHPFAMNQSDGNQIYLPTLNRLWRSLDGTANWTPISNVYGPDNYLKLGIAVTNKLNPIVYYGLQNSLFATPNAATAVPGDEIQKICPGSMVKILLDNNNDSALFYIKSSYNRNVVFRTPNFFNSNIIWDSLNFPSEFEITTIVSYPGMPNTYFAGCKTGGFYVSKDAGATWDKDNNFPNVRINEIKIRPSDNKVFIFTFGRGLWVADYSFPTSIANPTKPIDIEIYPNPSTEYLSIRNATGKILNYKILNFAGQEISNQIFTDVINISTIPSGTYFLELIDDRNRRHVKRFVKQ